MFEVFSTQFLITIRLYISLYKKPNAAESKRSQHYSKTNRIQPVPTPVTDILALVMKHWQKFVVMYFYFKGKRDVWGRGGCNPASPILSSTENCVTKLLPTQGQCTA